MGESTKIPLTILINADPSGNSFSAPLKIKIPITRKIQMLGNIRVIVIQIAQFFGLRSRGSIFKYDA